MLIGLVVLLEKSLLNGGVLGVVVGVVLGGLWLCVKVVV